MEKSKKILCANRDQLSNLPPPPPSRIPKPFNRTHPPTNRTGKFFGPAESETDIASGQAIWDSSYALSPMDRANSSQESVSRYENVRLGDVKSGYCPVCSVSGANVRSAGQAVLRARPLVHAFGVSEVKTPILLSHYVTLCH